MPRLDRDQDLTASSGSPSLVARYVGPPSDLMMTACRCMPHPGGGPPQGQGGLVVDDRGGQHPELARLIGLRIRWARELVQPNRAEFARGMGVDTSTVRDIENGRRMPSVFLLIELCHQLRAHPGYVLLGELRGTDGELAALLAMRHPEMVPVFPLWNNGHTNSPDNNVPAPMKRVRRRK